MFLFIGFYKIDSKKRSFTSWVTVNNPNENLELHISREDIFISLHNIYNFTPFEATNSNATNMQFFDGNFLSAVKLGPVVLFSEAKDDKRYH